MRILFFTAFGLLAAAGFFALSLMANAGQFKTLEPLEAGDCVRVFGAVGAEDLTVDRERRVALISSTDRRSGEARGAIYAYSLDQRPGRLVNLTSGFEGDLNPHGISLFRGVEKSVLSVVNHTAGDHSIELFDWVGGRLTHTETLTSDLLVSPNDVVGLGPRELYVTNDHGSAGPARLFEDYLRLRRGNVVHFDGDEFSVAADGIAYANGINASPDGREVYVASTTRGEIHLFVRDLGTGRLEPNHRIVVGSGVDNIEVDRHGMLWVGAHPKLLSFVAHSAARSGGAARPSPSQVVWIDPNELIDPPIRDAYLDLGEEISGSSVAAVWGSRLLIGSVFEEHFLDCERDPDG